MPPPAAGHPADLDERELLKQCTLRRKRTSGPGGQHRNKVETAVVALHEPTGVQAEASERRSAAQNQEVALRRLRVRLAESVRTPREDVPSALWKSRCSKAGRISVSDTNAAFPSLVAEALDCLAAAEWDVRAAADRLGCSTSQLVKLLANAPTGLRQLNDARAREGLKPLRP